MAKTMKFPISKTKIEGLNRKFNLLDPKEQKEYFELKVGKEIEKLRNFLKENTFVAYLLGKKNSGKGTYSKMFAEVVLPERIDHFSIGDMVRAVDGELKDEKKKKELIDYLEKNYRGHLSLEEIIFTLENRSTKNLLPTELILVLVKREIEKREKKTLFIDGFPRELDQIGFSLFFRDLIGHRDDQDIFILIDVPENVIDQRIKFRRVCPICQTSRNLKLFPTSKIGYDKKNKEFYLICDNPNCKGEKMQRKEGDEFGIEPIKERVKMDGKLIEESFSLYGIPKILLRNSIPVKEAKNFVDDYEITPEYVFEWNEKENKVKISQRPWILFDDERMESFSLLPQPVVVSLIKQMVDVFNL
jgi:adenylate kinase family enzyme